MKPFKKNFDSQDFVPFRFVYCQTKTPESELPNHFHDWYEIVYVYGGKGTFFIDYSFIDMEKGDFFVIPANTIHYSIPNSESPITSSVIFFNPLLIANQSSRDTFSYLQIFDESSRLNNYRYSLNNEQQKQLETLIDNIESEFTQKKSGYNQAAVLQLQLILLHINRSIIHQHSSYTTSQKFIPMWLRMILEYIEDHFSEKITLSFLAEYGNISSAHLSRVFKQMTGLNVSEYIKMKKILKAKQLLLKTEENVSSIADQCGFESMPYFHRTFKKMMDMTPSQYRNSTKA
ncbi:AraC family transcriptional regulator [Metabacillus halosaccharovorans]|uniref:AraC family transcriptional regulator n=1 Tax=Metabacillus halosaccharovorans TaxID=930124 RepID=UPI001C1F6651|nr:AraC family transcriptional regulator [Metabacillus halosaccharovorans]MBU7592664.1 AraC family transcriptional regulator [Metabacillus halosaccharovorans]